MASGDKIAQLRDTGMSERAATVKAIKPKKKKKKVFPPQLDSLRY